MKGFILRLLSIAILATLPLGTLTIIASMMQQYHYLGVPKIPVKRHSYVPFKIEEWQIKKEYPNYIFVGSSTCMYGIHNPTLLEYGISSFSFCTPSQTLLNSRDIISNFLNEPIKSTIIIDIYPDLWYRDLYSEESAIEWMLASDFRSVNSLKQTISTTARLLPNNRVALLLFLQSALQSMTARPTQPPISPDGNSKYNSLGSVSKLDFNYKKQPCPENPYRDFTSQITTLRELEGLITVNGKSMMLHLPPTLCEFQLDTTGISEFEFIDGTKWHGHQKEQYFDHDDHLIREASIQYSQWLAIQIQEFESTHAQQQP